MIQTERLILRRAHMEDLDDLHLVFSNAEAMRYWDSLPYEKIEQTRHLLFGMVADPGTHSDDFVVEFESRAIDKAGSWRMGEIGFILHPEHWRKGLTHEALNAVIPHVFDTLPVDKLEADVDPRNSVSLGLLKKLGFSEVGRAARTIKVGDTWCDSVYLELPRPA